MLASWRSRKPEPALPVEETPQPPASKAALSPSTEAPTTAESISKVAVWDPQSHHVWCVSRTNALHEMELQKSGWWELPCDALIDDAAYAFLTEWSQSWTISGSSVRFGLPHSAAGVEALADPGEAPAPVPGNFSTSDDGGEGGGAADDVECSLQTVMLRSSANRLGEAEFLFEVQDMGQYAVDATGARINLTVAARLHIESVTVAASDGSWGPVMLHRCQPEEIEDSSLVGGAALGGGNTMKSAVRGPVGSTPPPATWIGDAVDLEFGTDQQVELVVTVRRRDWRIDPRALALEPNSAEALAAGAQLSVAAPNGPELWSLPIAPPEAPAHFDRCGDRDLILYELHIGSFTPEGTLQAATKKLGHIASLGCTAISVMPVHQDATRLKSRKPDVWGYDVISFAAIDDVYGCPADLLDFVNEAHRLGLAVFMDYVINHMMWGADAHVGPQWFLSERTEWGPRPDFAKPEVREYCLFSAELLLTNFGLDGLRIDSTKSIRKMPSGGPDAAGAGLLSQLGTLCRQHGKLAIAEDLEDGEGILQLGGLGLNMQWDMAFFCWVFEALVNPMDEHRDLEKVVRGLEGLSPARSHLLRGRVLFMESHDTAASDRYGRFPAAVHNGKAFMAIDGEVDQGGDAFQKMSGSLPYPTPEEVEANPFAARRAALALVMLMTAPGIPMFLQGQEVYECKPYKWPRGPQMDWSKAESTKGFSCTWQALCKKLTKLRRGFWDDETGNADSSPFLGDGLHVCHSHEGVLAFLRWNEPTDSRTPQESMLQVGLVVVNCTNTSFPSYELGVPPSSSWSLLLSTVKGSEVSGKQSTETVLQVETGKSPHGLPCMLSLALPAYSAAVLVRKS
mmetsp:Transcript_68056/g.148375  ORF Transcript_68056/g.148375 Transcript_68056/m.148375 type:complete len:851 (+) Transcript_68056:91-2643(+)